MTLRKVDYEVLNAACDDWESLEQIFISVRFEFVSDAYNPSRPDMAYWRERNRDLTLSEIAAALNRMVESGLMMARLEDGTLTTTPPVDVAIECWYRTTDDGLSELEDVELT